MDTTILPLYQIPYPIQIRVGYWYNHTQRVSGKQKKRFFFFLILLEYAWDTFKIQWAPIGQWRRERKKKKKDLDTWQISRRHTSQQWSPTPNHRSPHSLSRLCRSSTPELLLPLLANKSLKLSLSLPRHTCSESKSQFFFLLFSLCFSLAIWLSGLGF